MNLWWTPCVSRAKGQQEAPTPLGLIYLWRVWLGSFEKEASPFRRLSCENRESQSNSMSKYHWDALAERKRAFAFSNNNCTCYNISFTPERNKAVAAVLVSWWRSHKYSRVLSKWLTGECYSKLNTKNDSFKIKVYMHWYIFRAIFTLQQICLDSNKTKTDFCTCHNPKITANDQFLSEILTKNLLLQ